MRKRSKRNRRRFGSRWAVRFLAGRAPDVFLRALQNDPNRPLQLLVPHVAMANDPMLRRAVVQLAGAPAPDQDCFRVFMPGSDL